MNNTKAVSMSPNPSKCDALLPLDQALVRRLEQEVKARMSDIVKADIETGAANGRKFARQRFG
jgi:hypothetical protein